ncbi:FMN-binding protein [Candidatus Symbiopectobacterium sp. NZEC135]|uniref:FMN-binding protein n=1 Tax=Candidatus Symbiopectobacterium sp. NZEC135 TaxID=2820471 RepID=UPI0022274EEA|nr:FMN-binding protein [Candidatus Symbiopectobacterium sp. NZEC135]
MMKKTVPSLVAAAALLFVASAGVQAAQTYKDGTYTGKAQGKEGEIEVSVKVSEGKIANVEVVKHEDTEALMLGVIDNIVPEIVEKQTADGIDAVTGATMSSTGVLEAAKQALAQAKS